MFLDTRVKRGAELSTDHHLVVELDQMVGKDAGQTVRLKTSYRTWMACGTRWRDYISRLSWEHLGIPLEELSKVSGSGFHKILKCLVMNNGTHKLKKGKQINLYMKEEKIKAKLSKTIRERKKTVYNSLTTTECYNKASGFTGKGSVEEMRETIVKHVHKSKNIMFEKAQNEMLSQLRDLKVFPGISLCFNKCFLKLVLNSSEEHFQNEGIDKETFLSLRELRSINVFIPKIGPRVKFRKRLKEYLQAQTTSKRPIPNPKAQGSDPLVHRGELQHMAAELGSYKASPHQLAMPLTLGNSRVVEGPVQPSPLKELGSRAQAMREQDIDEESIYNLDDQDIVALMPKVGPRSTFKKRLKLLKVCPSTSDTREEIILSDVKNIMRCVHERIPNQDNKLNKFLNTFSVCIFQPDHNPYVNPCTTGIKSVTWRQIRGSWFGVFANADQGKEDDDDDDDDDTVDKLSALYGEEWRNKTHEDLMDRRYFREIPEFLSSERKILSCESAEELSARFVKYTKSGSKDGEGKEVKRWYWPLVKCVTVRVPDNDLLQHVTLVDLPGNGDRNKSRDKMWKEVVGSCSAVWIVTDINRAGSEKEPWEILKSASSLMGNGGECQHIHFICTKSDVIEDPDELSADAVCARIYKRNMQVKEEMSKEFSKLHEVKKHFSAECFKVFTVSSKEFKKKTHIYPEKTLVKIPKLKEFLQNLNDCHSKTSNYVSGAYGILSLIQGSRCTEVAGEKTDVCTDLEENIRFELEKVRKPMEEACESFEKCLSEGVENAKKSYEKVLRSFLHHHKRSGRGFHRILKCLVKNNGTYTPKKGKQINLNMKLASLLTDSIDEEFQRTFPNEGKGGPFNKAISKFSLHTETLIEKYKRVELQLTFLKTEVKYENTIILSFINKTIRERKKTVYSSLTMTIEEIMQECYKKAARFTGDGSLKNMRETIVKHVYDSKNIMFEQAKNEMLSQLRGLKEEILRTLEGTMQKSIDLSLKTDGVLIPDVAVELAEVKKYSSELEDTLMKRDEFVLDHQEKVTALQSTELALDRLARDPWLTIRLPGLFRELLIARGSLPANLQLAHLPQSLQPAPQPQLASPEPAPQPAGFQPAPRISDLGLRRRPSQHQTAAGEGSEAVSTMLSPKRNSMVDTAF
ncbi:hypothetical protein L3Q82_014190 [Scortum barcoo]|uniref:Uncharacterized protein n=1 Tax=Scortum barcoo TaxID=214431 RepID=A0ACB8VWK4_9TELE|nr:hypothetical protein L3Q82_014190 [Scortum barcoo]